MAKRRMLRPAPQGDNQIEMFVPDVGDIPIKDKHSLMAYPLLYVGDYRGRAKPVEKVEYWQGGVYIEVTAPRDIGIATIRDYDVILFFISVITDWLNRGEDLSRGIEVHAHSILKFARRGDGRKQYDALEQTLIRLKSTTITMRSKDQNKETVKSVSWLDDFTFERDEITGKISTVKLTLPKWIYEASLRHKQILTLHADYFLLVPQARWLYRIMRKSAGNNAEGWRFSIEELYRRSGSKTPYRQWKYQFRELLKEGPVLDYHTNWVKDENSKETLYFMKDEQLLKLMEKPPEHLLEMQKPWLSKERLKLHKLGVYVGV